MATKNNYFKINCQILAILVLNILIAVQARVAKPALVPYPQQIVTQSTYLLIDSTQFQFIPKTDGQCALLQDAIKRYTELTFINDCSRLHSTSVITENDTHEQNANIAAKFANDSLFKGQLYNITIQVRQKCADLEWPQLNMDEMYTIRVDTEDFPNQAILFSNSIWGAIRGLETFSQLIQRSQGALYTVNSTFILDYPRFSHRGLLVDTARHFVPVHVLLDNLDLMAYHKLNVFHWHIVDDQSFPFVSETFPELSADGAYNQHLVYTESDIETVVEYARLRGIRVLMEFDTPGHTLSWGKAIQSLLTACYSGGVPDGTYGPIDPSVNATYNFLATFYAEIAKRFPESFLHLGGDEVSYECWQSNPNILEFMKRIGIAGQFNKLEGYYLENLNQIVSNLNKSRIYWQEVIDMNISLSNNTVIHVWKSPYESELYALTKLGYPVLLSSCWYLNEISYGYDWFNYYSCEPLSFNGTEQQNRLVLGGEAAMWGEWVDGSNFLTRTWPRTVAVAERLWSPMQLNNYTAAQYRFVPNRCRLLARGFRVQPVVEPKQYDFSFCDCDYAI